MKLDQHVCLDEISLDFLKIGHVGSKTRSLVQILEKPCVHSRGHISCPIIMKLCQNVCIDDTLDVSENWRVGSKTRLLCQIFEKPCVRFRDHIFYSILMKLGQNVGLDKISDECENGSCRVKN